MTWASSGFLPFRPAVPAALAALVCVATPAAPAIAQDGAHRVQYGSTPAIPGVEDEAPVPPDEDLPYDLGPTPPDEDVPDTPVEVLPPPPPPAPPPPVVPPPGGKVVAVLQGLDKIMAQVSEIEVPVAEPATFGRLSILVRTCRKAPPTETPESAAFIEITDRMQDEELVQVFSGWMFASSPALSAMEHPVYDIWVKDCRIVAPDSTPDAEPSGDADTVAPPASDPAR